MLRAFRLSINQLGDPAIVAILVRSLVLTLLVFALLGVACGWALEGADPCGWIDDDSCPLGPGSSRLGALLLTGLGLWFLFPPVAIGVVSAYMDRVVGAVERRHYPVAAAGARRLGFGRGTLLGLKSSARLLLCNAIALPFYVILLVTGIGPLVLFLVVNGWAFGRDLGEMVAARHLDRPGRRAWLSETRGPRLVLGAIVTAAFLVPIVNLIAPVLAAAMATHLFHETRASDGAAAPLQG